MANFFEGTSYTDYQFNPADEYNPLIDIGLLAAPIYLQHQNYQHFVNIGVCGAAGSGKSSLVNALLGSSPGVRRKGAANPAAPVGIAAKKRNPVPYPFNDEFFSSIVDAQCSHPRKPILIWDLPGAGTRRWPQETYCNDLGIQFYDLFLVVSSRRVSEVDMMLVKELRDKGVPFLMVRTKMDIDVKNNELDHTTPEQETMDIIRQSLVEHGLPAAFLLSTRRPTKFELHQLCLNLYAWLRVHAQHKVEAVLVPSDSEPSESSAGTQRVQDAAPSDTQCILCTEDASGVETVMVPTTRTVEWVVEADRSFGSSLGIDIDSATLNIVAVLDMGLIPEWNRDHLGQECMVQAGDRICMVNGHIEADSVIAECMDSRLLEMKLTREVLDTKDGDDTTGLMSVLPGLLHRTCTDCGAKLCGKCAGMLGFVMPDGAPAHTVVLCPNCNRLMKDRDDTWGTWLFSWLS